MIMKRYLFLLLALICYHTTNAQEPLAEYTGPVKQWTSSFKSLDVDAPVKLTIVALPADQAPYIIYDTKGVVTSKFTVEVDRNGVLKIRERYDPKRVGMTEVKVFYNTLDNVKLSRADAVFEGTLKASIIDVIVSNEAKLMADIDIVRMVGINDSHPFSGTFLGNGHTITAAISKDSALLHIFFNIIDSSVFRVFIVFYIISACCTAFFQSYSSTLCRGSVLSDAAACMTAFNRSGSKESIP